MPTATIHIENPPGYAGRHSRCFALSEPYDGANFLVLWIQPPHGNLVGPEVITIPSDATGAPLERSLKRRPGSFVMHDNPFEQLPNGDLMPIPHLIEGGYWWALLQLGVTYIPADWTAS
jgi:hypothetical protein